MNYEGHGRERLRQALIEKERQLDLAFADKSIDRASLSRMLQQIAATQAQLRQAHLEAHLEQADILTPAQIAGYNKLRGYGTSSTTAPHGGHAH